MVIVRFVLRLVEPETRGRAALASRIQRTDLAPLSGRCVGAELVEKGPQCFDQRLRLIALNAVSGSRDRKPASTRNGFGEPPRVLLGQDPALATADHESGAAQVADTLAKDTDACCHDRMPLVQASRV